MRLYAILCPILERYLHTRWCLCNSGLLVLWPVREANQELKTGTLHKRQVLDMIHPWIEYVLNYLSTRSTGLNPFPLLPAQEEEAAFPFSPQLCSAVLENLEAPACLLQTMTVFKSSLSVTGLLPLWKVGLGFHQHLIL